MQHRCVATRGPDARPGRVRRALPARSSTPEDRPETRHSLRRTASPSVPARWPSPPRALMTTAPRRAAPSSSQRGCLAPRSLPSSPGRPRGGPAPPAGQAAASEGCCRRRRRVRPRRARPPRRFARASLCSPRALPTPLLPPSPASQTSPRPNTCSPFACGSQPLRDSTALLRLGNTHRTLIDPRRPNPGTRQDRPRRRRRGRRGRRPAPPWPPAQPPGASPLRRAPGGAGGRTA